MTAETLAERVGLPLLDVHGTQILFSAAGCHFVHVFGCMLSERSAHYRRLSAVKRASWGMHIVSIVFSVAITTLAAPLLLQNQLAKNGGSAISVLAEDPLFGHTLYSGAVYAIACGYFLWDTIMSIYYVSESGLGFVLHGISCLFVFLLSFKPFLHYFGGAFLLFEISTIFLNIHWFCDKTGLTGSRLQWINGIVLIFVFFFVRLVGGFYYSFEFYVESIRRWKEVPHSLFWVYAVANVILNGLNVWWFTRMIASVRSRFEGKHDASAEGSYGKLSRKSADKNHFKKKE